MDSYFTEQPSSSYRVTTDDDNKWIYLSFSPLFQTRTMLQEFDQVLSTLEQRQYDAIILDLSYADDVFTTFNRSTRILTHLSVSKYLQRLRFFAVVADTEDLFRLLKRYIAGLPGESPALFVTRQAHAAVQWIQTERFRQ